jgi:NAD(P)-dependent dehydrogenase (short-subunit alcohol dehydrogenase family)
MSTLPGKTVLITGANAGIGKDVARQLALRPEIARIYLACRNRERAIAAKAELEAETGRRIFDIVLMDVADLGSVRAGLNTGRPTTLPDRAHRRLQRRH